MFSSRRIVMIAAATALAGGLVARGQNPVVALDVPQLRIHRSEITGHATFMTSMPAMPGARANFLIPSPNSGTALQGVHTTADTFLASHGAHFGVRDPAHQLVRTASRQDRLGFTHARFRQVHKGVPVFSGAIIVHQNARGEVTSANGRFYFVPDTLGPTPAIDQDKAAAIAAATLEGVTPEGGQAELVVVDPGWYGDPPTGPRLAWHVVMHEESFFVDAQSGKVFDQWSARHAARDRRIYDGEGMADFPGLPRRFEGDPPVIDPADVDRAYDYLGDFYDFLWRAYGWDGLDGNGRPLIATANAGFSGCPNAFWDARLGQTVFCTGTVVDDLAAHESMHAVTHFTADLIFQNQPGQLNESFSDVFGELVDLFNGDAAFLGGAAGPTWPATATGPGSDDPNLPRSLLCNATPDYPDGVRWMFGEEATVFGLALRDMWNPTCYGMPDRANHPLQTCPRVDNGGAHSGSSIPNHAFAILTDGKTFNGYTVQGIGPIKAGAVWFRALTYYMTAADNFQDAYLALNQAAADLVGTEPNDPRTGLPGDVFTADDAAQVDLALRAVEMNTPSVCGIQPVLLDPGESRVCAGSTTVFFDDFEGGGAGWSVANSGPPTPYDWQRVSDLPRGRTGHAFFCPDENYGDCADADESAVHELISSPIALAGDAASYRLRFTHYIATEPGYDGGKVEVSINGGRWQRVAHPHFLFNPYSALLRSMSRGSTNPLAGSGGWTSAGGKWGVSVIDLSSLASGGDTIRLKFVFGKDACNGSHGWYVDDVEVYGCPDCNRNDVADDLDLEFRAMSAPLRQIGSESPRSFAFVSPPRASGDVSVDLWAMADLGNVGESMTLTLNGTPIGDAFVGTGRDCPNEADKDSVSIPASTFNDLVAGGDATFTLFGTFVVDAGICGANNFAAIAIHYATVTPDTDDNGVIDHCENCAAAESPAPPSPLAPARNRYISFVPQNAERLTALRVTPVELPSDFGHLGGQHHWVAKPWMVTPDGHAFSRLGCRQEFLEWSSYAVVHVGDDEIVPGARYDVQAFDLACAQSAPEDDPGRGDLDFEAPPHRAWTASAWGDLTNEPGQAPRLDVQDVAALVDILRDAGGGADIAAADLEPAVPNGRVDAIDLAAVVDAVRGEMYPFSVECLCCRERVGPSHNSAIRRQTVLPQSSGLPGSNGYD